MSVSATKLGEWMKQRRKTLDLTQEELADRVGCSSDTIRKVESGARRPSRQVAALLAETLGVPPEDRASFAQWARRGFSDDEADTVLAGPYAVSGAALDLFEESRVALGARVPGLPDRSGGETSQIAERPVTNPYKGLRAFEEEDASDFFGREALAARLLARLQETSRFSHFLAVVGPSGSGKSSLVQAGLIHALRASGLPDARTLLVASMLPGTRPPQELDAALLRAFSTAGYDHARDDSGVLGKGVFGVDSASALGARLRTAKWGLGEAVSQAMLVNGHPDAGVLLFIDQFEEIFTLTADERVRSGWLSDLYRTVGDQSRRLWVVVTMRADFYDRPLLYPGMSELFGERTEVVGPMSYDDLHMAIVGPARRVGLELEEGLVGAIERDVAEQPGALPLLQYALTELYERRTGRTLTLQAYRESGGVLQALGARAEALYSWLTPAEQEEVRQMFLRLVVLGEGGGGEGRGESRRRVLRSELASAARDEEALDGVLDLLGSYRLLTFDRDPITKGPTVEVAHEALLSTWTRLRRWLDESRERLRVQRLLMAASEEWAHSSKDPGLLASGTHLAQFEALAEGADRPGGVSLTTEERNYLASSAAERDRQEKAEGEREVRELQLQKRAASRLRYLLAGAVVFLAIASILAVWAVNQSRVADDNAKQAQANYTRSEAQRLAAEANTLLQVPGKPSQLIGLLTVRSLNTLYTPQGDIALIGALPRQYPVVEFKGNPLLIWSIQFSPNGKYLVTADSDSIARLWDVHTGKEVREFKGHKDMLKSVAFSPDGRYILTGSADNTAKLWDVETGKEVRTFVGHAQRINGVAFSPNGKYVLTGSRDKTARLWDLQTGKELHEFISPDRVSTVAFSPDGKVIATYSIDKLTRLWDVQTGALLRSVPDSASSFAFSPDGKYLMVGTDQTTEGLWDIQTGEVVRRFVGHTRLVESVAFSPDGKYAVTGSDDLTAKLWDVETGKELRTYSGHTDTVYAVAFSPDGKYVATAGADNLALLWDAYSPPDPPQFEGHTDAVESASFSPDDRYVLTTSLDHTTRLWDSQRGREIRAFTAHTAYEPQAQFSSDGKRILMTDSDNTAKLFEVATGKELRTYKFEGIAAPISRIYLSPSDNYIVTASDADKPRIWDAQTGKQLWQLTEGGTASFSPDGKYVLTGGNGATEIKMWEAATGSVVRTFVGHGAEVNFPVFSNDGKWVLAGSLDKTAILWDATTGKEVRQFVGHAGPLDGVVSFSPDSKYILTTSGDQTARLWETATGQELRRLSSPEGVGYASFSHDGKWVVTTSTSNDAVARLWQVDYHNAVRSLCSRLTRDFTNDERAQYEIKDNIPTCPKQ